MRALRRRGERARLARVAVGSAAPRWDARLTYRARGTASDHTLSYDAPRPERRQSWPSPAGRFERAPGAVFRLSRAHAFFRASPPEAAASRASPSEVGACPVLLSSAADTDRSPAWAMTRRSKRTAHRRARRNATPRAPADPCTALRAGSPMGTGPAHALRRGGRRSCSSKATASGPARPSRAAGGRGRMASAWCAPW